MGILAKLHNSALKKITPWINVQTNFLLVYFYLIFFLFFFFKLVVIQFKKAFEKTRNDGKMHSFSRRISLFHYVLNYMSVSAFHRDHVIHHPHGDTFFIFLLKDNLHTPKCIYHNYPSSCHFSLCSWSYHSVCRKGQPTFFSIWTGCSVWQPQ